MKRKVIFYPIIMTITSLLLIVAIYAWYVQLDRVHDMSFNILQIESLVTLYEADDSNYNGVPNLLSDKTIDKYYNKEVTENQGFVNYSNLYHHENYAFNYLDQKYALSQDSSANLLNTIEIVDIAPSKIYGYKFEITNYSGRDNVLEFLFESKTYDSLTELGYFEARLGVVDEDNKLTFTSWTDFVNNNAYTGFELNPFDEDIIIEAESRDLDNRRINGRLDLWLQIRIKKEVETLLQGTFELPMFRIKMSLADE